MSDRRQRLRIFSSDSVMRFMANSPLPRRKNSWNSDKTSKIRLSGRSFSSVFRDRESRMSVITPERLDAVIGKGIDDNNRRCDDTRPSEPLDDAPPLTRTWFRDLPMKRIDAAIEVQTKPGHNSGLMTYS